VGNKAADFTWLIEELNSEIWDAQDLRRALFRSAKHSRKVAFGTEDCSTREIGEAFAKSIRIGFVFTTEIKEILWNRIITESEPAECIRALKALQERRTIELNTFQEWRESVKTRFGEEIFKTAKMSVEIDQEMTRKKLTTTKSKHEALLLMRTIEAANARWKDRIQSCLAEAKEAYRTGFQEVYEEWLSIRKVI
jgi:hypothetical protein